MPISKEQRDAAAAANAANIAAAKERIRTRAIGQVNDVRGLSDALQVPLKDAEEAAISANIGGLYGWGKLSEVCEKIKARLFRDRSDR